MSTRLDRDQSLALPHCVTVIEQFIKQVSATPDAIAIVYENSQLSYLQLDQLANRFSNALSRAGLQRGDTVGLCMDRRPEAIASMLGAFKIGIAYVPLDPEYPADRVRYMIEDADVRAVITHDIGCNSLASQLCALFESHSPDHRSLQWIDSATDAFANESAETALDLPASDELAYIMYTSGSTGMPKGVQIEHGSLKVYCDADREVYELAVSDRTLQFSTLNFDIAIEEIFPPLLVGGVVVIRPQSRSATSNELSSIIDQFQVTAIHIATAYWHEWVDLMMASQTPVPASLRLVIATGEKVSVEHYRRWKRLCRQNVKWCNAYGPTETTVTATVFVPDDNFDMPHMPIGKPLAGYEAFILDDSNRPLGIGETGQLFISGPALARGYHKNPAKTAAAFLTVELPNRGLTRIYRTGDLARWLPSGDIEFAGRVDHQIKVGSYRIEPGEIEVAIARFEGVLESIVVHEEVNGQKFLIAYVAIGTNPLSPRSLQEYLRTMLPIYMVPPRYIMLSALPKTINGKIDRSRLPAANTSEPVVDEDFIAPRSEMEKKLAEIWQQVLHHPKIGVHDDFFALGGSSLLVTRVVTAITSDSAIDLPVRDFFANPTIASSSLHIERLIARRNGIVDTSSGPKRSAMELPKRLPIVDARMIPCADGWLFSVRYEPQTNRRQQGVLICNSIGHEHTRSYRNLQQLALRFTDAGFDVMRFDYRGTGNSSGECHEISADSLIKDVNTAASYLRQTTSIRYLSMLGIRLGATVAAIVAKNSLASAPVDQMILWDPVIEGKNFVDMLDRFHKDTLLNQNRYTHVLRRTDRDQAYGHTMNNQKRSSLSSLRLMDASLEKNRDLVVVSHDYQANEPGITGLERLSRIQQTSDHIHWHELDFAERAFSSPDAYQSIVNFLTRYDEKTLAMLNPVMPVSTQTKSLDGALIS